MKIFFIENEDGEILEREKANSTCADGVFKPGEHWTFFSLGIGKEICPGRKILPLLVFSIEIWGLRIQKGLGSNLRTKFRISVGLLYNVTHRIGNIQNIKRGRVMH